MISGRGSGCIAIALYRNLLFPEIEAIDISPEAIAIAKKNAAKLNANINFIQADIFHIDLREEKFDIIVSNPPYIGLSEKKDMESNVTDHEPHSALFVPDSDPTIYYKRITSVASDCLRPEGRIYYEVNPLHAGQVAEELADAGFSGISIVKDMYAKDRFVTAILDSNK